MATTKILLLEDVDSVGKKGDLASVRPGYARNFLYPQNLAVRATAVELRRQARLQEERRKKAVVDKAESEHIAGQIEAITLPVVVKVDHDGHMYGSVTIAEILHLLEEHTKVKLEKKNILLKHAIKETGVHKVPVKLKEEVTASFNLKVMSEEGFKAMSEEASSTEK